MNDILCFLFGFLCAWPLRIAFGRYYIATLDKDGFRWVLKWKRFDD